MKSMKRVVVTGMGAITPIGNSVEEFWNGIKEQKIGFAPITYFDATVYKAHLLQKSKVSMQRLYVTKSSKTYGIIFTVCCSCNKEAIEDAGLDLEKKIQQELVYLLDVELEAFR